MLTQKCDQATKFKNKNKEKKSEYRYQKKHKAGEVNLKHQSNYSLNKEINGKNRTQKKGGSDSELLQYIIKSVEFPTKNFETCKNRKV